MSCMPCAAFAVVMHVSLLVITKNTFMYKHYAYSVISIWAVMMTAMIWSTPHNALYLFLSHGLVYV